ncbi:hypothetical protein GCM10010398_11860 [Streptomyces fimbriatus]
MFEDGNGKGRDDDRGRGGAARVPGTGADPLPASITAVALGEPRPPVRAGALEPVLRGPLAKDPERRTTARTVRAEPARIVAPQWEAYARTQTGLGSPSPREAPARRRRGDTRSRHRHPAAPPPARAARPSSPAGSARCGPWAVGPGPAGDPGNPALVWPCAP